MIETENILLVDDITFLDVEPGKVYTKNVKIENTVNVPVDFTIEVPVGTRSSRVDSSFKSREIV